VNNSVSLAEYCRLAEILSDHAIFALSTDGHFVGWNAGATQMFGYTAEEVLGHHYAMLFTGEDVEKRRPQAELMSSLPEWNVPVAAWQVRKDGSRFWCADTARPIRDAGGNVTGYVKLVRDATDRFSTDHLRYSEELFNLLIDGVPDYAIFSINLDGTIALWNSGAERVYGYSDAEAVGKHFSLVYTADAVAEGIPEAEIGMAARTGIAPDEGWHVRRGGDLFYSSGEMTRLKSDANGKLRGYVKIAHDTTSRSESTETVKRKVLIDFLTQLPNRASFSELLERTVVHAGDRLENGYAVVFVDLDHFKNISDSLGRVLADGLLVQVARILEFCVRPDDVVARLGGDLFAILLRDISGTADATRIAERIQAALEHSIYLEGFEVYTTASMGIAMGSPAHAHADDPLGEAGTAMHEAKALGRARHVVFDNDRQARVAQRLNVQMDLRRALARREFFNEYQPIVALADGRVIGFEALVRWRHPERGIIQPGDFIPEAEAIGLVIGIDRWVLYEACRQIRAWQVRYGDESLTMSVNLSSKQFAHQDLLGEIQKALLEAGLAPQSLKLEITETVLMEDFDTAAATTNALSDLGVELYIDDFGTGYSSLSRLTRLPLKVLKVARPFVMDISSDPRTVEIGRTIVTLAHNLNLVALAEGIETEFQLATLQSLGCEYGQGYLFSRPVAAEMAQQLIGRTLPLPV
jgi:diguanylate cyclase (GGDEF)-like protein/PAS domain S-box-containing protein